MTPFTAADHVTEREPGRWEDCTFASLLETLRLGLPDGRAIPATITEVNRFRAEAGFPDNHQGATIEDALPAARRLYGLRNEQYSLTRSWDTLEVALRNPRTVCAVSGHLGSVPATLLHPEWDDFTGNHMVAGRGHLTVPTWCDPRGPKDGNYAGEPVTMATWRAFFTALPGAQAFIMEAAMPTVYAAGGIVLTSTKKARFTANGDLLLEPNGARVAAAVAGREYPLGAIVAGHHMVLVPTALPYPDHVSRPTWLFVKAAISTVLPVPIAVPPPGGTVDTGPAVQAEWEAWVTTHPK